MKKLSALLLMFGATLALSLSSCSPYHCNGSWRGGSVSGRNTFGPKRSSFQIPVTPLNPVVQDKEIRL